MKALLQRLLGGLRPAAMSPYESANPSRSRANVPGAAPGDAKRDLTPATRREIVRRSRYVTKNSGFAREVISDMAIYATGDGIKPQAQTEDLHWNRAAEDVFARWAARPEITNRFSFEECQNLVCRGIDTDGEYFVLKVRDAAGRARIQLVESHRIADGNAAKDTADGLVLDAYGAPVAYRFVLDDGKTRDVPADAVMHVFEPEAASAVRATPSLQHSFNHLLDEMELLAVEKLAVKDNAGISRVIRNESGDPSDTGDFQVATGGEPAEPATDPKAVQEILGGKVVGLKPGETMDAHQPNRPSPVFTGFLEHLKRDSSAGVLPYEFVMDSSKIGGAGVRLIVAKADRRFSYRQLILIQRFLLPVWGYVIGDAIARGELAPAPGWTRVAWTTPRRITVDAGREAQQNRADVEAGLKTLADHFAELGMDFEEELEIRAQNAKRILETATRYGVPVEMLWKPQGGIGLTPPGADPERPPVDEDKRE